MRFIIQSFSKLVSHMIGITITISITITNSITIIIIIIIIIINNSIKQNDEK